jgi:outer membrane lipopolysaccharide assembly protein LptE/RlpB
MRSAVPWSTDSAPTSPAGVARERVAPFRARVAVLIAVAAFALLSGCGYTTRPMYPMAVRTVYVPMFESMTYRRGLEMQLTEAVVKEIEQKTPFKVVKGPSADTVLKGRILSVDKRVLAESPTDEARVVQVRYVVSVTWQDARSGVVLSSGELPLEPDVVRVTEADTFVPEVGQTFSTASDRIIGRLAQQIVAMMEEPW